MTRDRIKELREWATHTHSIDLYGMLEEALKGVESTLEQLDAEKAKTEAAEQYLAHLREEFLSDSEQHLELEDGINLTLFRLYDELERVEQQRDEARCGSDSDYRKLRLERDILEDEVERLTTERDQLEGRVAELEEVEKRHAELVAGWKREMRLAANAVLRYRARERELEKREAVAPAKRGKRASR